MVKFVMCVHLWKCFFNSYYSFLVWLCVIPSIIVYNLKFVGLQYYVEKLKKFKGNLQCFLYKRKT